MEGDGEIKPDGLNVYRLPVWDETGLGGRFDFTLDMQRNYDGALDERGHVNMEGNVVWALPLLGLKLVAKRRRWKSW